MDCIKSYFINYKCLTSMLGAGGAGHGEEACPRSGALPATGSIRAPSRPVSLASSGSGSGISSGD